MKRFDRPEQFASFRRSFYSFGGRVGKRALRFSAATALIVLARTVQAAAGGGRV